MQPLRIMTLDLRSPLRYRLSTCADPFGHSPWAKGWPASTWTAAALPRWKSILPTTSGLRPPSPRLRTQRTLPQRRKRRSSFPSAAISSRSSDRMRDTSERTCSPPPRWNSRRTPLESPRA
jgi:hypothetical protein